MHAKLIDVMSEIEEYHRGKTPQRRPAPSWFGKALRCAAILLAGAWPLAAQGPPDDFPIVEKQFKDGSELFHLHSDYGFIARWEGGGRASFFLYDKPRTNILTTSELGTFLEGLSKFPEGAEVAWVNTCGAPLHYGMPAEMLSQIEDVLRQRKFKLAGIEENNFVLCTCQATNLLFFTTAPTKSAASAGALRHAGDRLAPASGTDRTSPAAGLHR